MTGQPRNVLYVNSGTAMSGAEFSLLGLIQNIDRQRFVPVLLVPEEGPFAKKAKEAGIETVVLPSLIRFGEGYRPRTMPKAGRAVLALAKIIRAKKVRLVHSNSPRAAYLGGTAARLCSLPSVVHVRDIYLSPFLVAWKARLLGRLSDVIIAVSAAVRHSIVERTPSLDPKVRVVYNGVDLEGIDKRPAKSTRAELGIGPENPLLVSVGILHPAKGQDVLLRAAASLKPDFPSLRVLIVGAPLLKSEEAYTRELKDLADRLGLRETVTFTGFREDVLDLMAAADILVHAAVYPEPFPRSILEALALRKPVVATKVGGVPEIIEDRTTGLLVEPSDPKSLAAAVADLLRDRPKALTLAQNGRKTVESKFAMNTHVDAISALYEKLLEPS